ncbi:uncharacterized protein K460DRAFT_365635 [Cucurbitaria berberidis CBS 394.84]|uniref:Uncharacterized protein n=1 Tax=Cucurbitaria berberidis CBS 394.84 TaxID=1168544 RepID=A0A9P4L790_9PLEO|nr:uncharacterized protein K460DRAFT_365635 [Cucurbitaria berberidis CBS 394.84]KAF1844685.1 hypothetical protein K460DRAFT_365635 [Cucurbitaria berberidis CBS 394.84]
MTAITAITPTSTPLCKTCDCDCYTKLLETIMAENRELKRRLDKAQQPHLRQLEHQLQCFFVYMVCAVSYWIIAQTFVDDHPLVAFGSWLLFAAVSCDAFMAGFALGMYVRS